MSLTHNIPFKAYRFKSIDQARTFHAYFTFNYLFVAKFIKSQIIWLNKTNEVHQCSTTNINNHYLRT